MPTTVTEYDEAHQAEQVMRHQALPVAVDVWAADTPFGPLRLRKLGTSYALGDDGLRLFGVTDYFGPDVAIHAGDDADAVRSAKLLILSRARAEVEQMSAAFFPVVGADPPAPVCPHCQDTGVVEATQWAPNNEQPCGECERGRDPQFREDYWRERREREAEADGDTEAEAAALA